MTGVEITLEKTLKPQFPSNQPHRSAEATEVAAGTDVYSDEKYPNFIEHVPK